MFHNTIIYLLAFTSTVCYGYERQISTPIADLGKQGAIFGWGPEETLKFIFHSTTNTEKLDIWFNVGSGEFKREFHLRCLEFEKKGDSGLKQYRANYFIKRPNLEGEETEIDEFAVTACNEDVLKKTILFYTEEANKYIVRFRDTNSNPKSACFLREIKVDDQKELSSVTRSNPVNFNCNKIPYLNENYGVVVPKSWRPTGTFDDVFIPDRRLTYNLLGNGECENCFVTCRWTYSDKGYFGVVDVVVRGIPVDRLHSTSCTQYSIDSSIWLHAAKDWTGEKEGENSKPKLLIYLNYLLPDGECKRREIDLEEQPVENEPFLKRVTYQRFGFFDVPCKKMKMKGKLRWAMHKTKLHAVFSR